VLHRRGPTFTSRVVVPRDLRALLHRSEISRSLRTTDAREAARRCALWEPHVRALFSRVRQRGRTMTRDELDALKARSGAISLHSMSDRVLTSVTALTVYSYPRPLSPGLHAPGGGNSGAF
jgi:hypothetical protein